jgi:hypothetical protein
MRDRLDRSALLDEHVLRSLGEEGSPSLNGTALYNPPGALAPQETCEAKQHGRRKGVKAVRRVVWNPGADCASVIFFVVRSEDFGDGAVSP